jgi:hypothetical protein
MSSLYEILGVDPSASHAELRRAYLATIAEVHPDRARTAGEIDERTRLTASVTAAWAVLGDAASRAAYDRSSGAGLLPRPLRRLRSLLARRRWVVGRPHPRIDLAPVRSVTGAGWALVYETRLGQWLLVLAVSSLAASLGGATAGAAAAAAVGLLLAGGGEPTPLADARAISIVAGRAPGAILRRFTSASAGWLSPRLAEAIERERRYGADVSSHLERTRRAIGKEGELRRPAPPPSTFAPKPGRRRPSRPPRGSGRPRSRRP